MHACGSACIACICVQVRVFDASLRIVAWFEDIAGGPITSVSFAASGGSVGRKLSGARVLGAIKLFALETVIAARANGRVLQHAWNASDVMSSGRPRYMARAWQCEKYTHFAFNFTYSFQLL